LKFQLVPSLSLLSPQLFDAVFARMVKRSSQTTIIISGSF
jgi:hypothetical protein